MSWQLSDFNYELPPELIAQRPLAARTGSRLCYVKPSITHYKDGYFSDVLDFLSPGDLLVLNNTKVLPARLFGRKPTGGRIECLFERTLSDCEFLAHIRANRRLPPGAHLLLAEDQVSVEVLGREDDLYRLKLRGELSVLEMLKRYGQCPLPPYITHQPDAEDEERYQTVFAEQEGALAAPTAGLHFDQDFLERLKQKGVRCCSITLHVGAGTFQPVRVTNIAEHKMHAEWIEVSDDVCHLVSEARCSGHRVMAVGTTVLRALETAALGGTVQPFCGETRLFVTPGFQFRVVDSLLTNFHLPQSTLLMLVSAFGGYDLMREVYQFAIAERYRFFSYGDAMLIDRTG